MLTELNEVGKWFQDEAAEGWHFREVKFDEQSKEALSGIGFEIEFYDFSARIEGPTKHSYVPSHYFLYALKMQPLVNLLINYVGVFEEIKAQLKTPEAIEALIKSDAPSNSITDELDALSRENFYSVFKEKEKRLKGKDIINRKDGVTKLRANEDFICSIILKALPVPDVSSDILSKIVFKLSQNPAALKVLEEKYAHAIPYQFVTDTADDLIYKILSSLGWKGSLDYIFESSDEEEDIIDWDEISGAFKLNTTKVVGNPTYYEEPIHFSEKLNKYVHFRKNMLDDEGSREKIANLIGKLWKGFIICEEDSKFLFKSRFRKSVSATRVTGGCNKIIYGAPGTGKSHSILSETERAEIKPIITVFHPDTQFSDFVGSLKPHTKESDEGAPIVTYEYRPGPFIKALVAAQNNPASKVFLVIEEINRAPAAAVFGELFQLLDRNTSGESTYGIEAADPDLIKFIEANIDGQVSELKIPSNLYIYATMNSSDQAVMPLDTAFKRRWSFQYLKLNFENAPAVELELMTSSGVYNISWAVFAEKVLNVMLKRFRVEEDRLIGPFFLNEVELTDWKSAVSGKLFVYLWDDVLRHKLSDRKRLFNEEIETFGDLFDAFVNDASISIFAEETEDLIKKHGTVVESTDG